LLETDLNRPFTLRAADAPAAGPEVGHGPKGDVPLGMNANG
jgi:hypothetical protein